MWMPLASLVSPVTAPPVAVGCTSDYDCPDHAACENREGHRRSDRGGNFPGVVKWGGNSSILQFIGSLRPFPVPFARKFLETAWKSWKLSKNANEIGSPPLVHCSNSIFISIFEPQTTCVLQKKRVGTLLLIWCSYFYTRKWKWKWNWSSNEPKQNWSPKMEMEMEM